MGLDIYTLLYVREVSNEDLLYRTENSTQYSAVPYKGKVSTKEWCVHGSLIHFAACLKGTQYDNATTHANKKTVYQKAYEECLAHKNKQTSQQTVRYLTK